MNNCKPIGSSRDVNDTLLKPFVKKFDFIQDEMKEMQYMSFLLAMNF